MTGLNAKRIGSGFFMVILNLFFLCRQRIHKKCKHGEQRDDQRQVVAGVQTDYEKITAIAEYHVEEVPEEPEGGHDETGGAVVLYDSKNDDEHTCGDNQSAMQQKLDIKGFFEDPEAEFVEKAVQIVEAEHRASDRGHHMHRGKCGNS